MKSSLILTAFPLLLGTPALAHEDDHEQRIERHHWRFPESFELDPENMPIMGFGSMRGGRLGVQVSEMTEELREVMGAPKTAGILVNKVMPDSPAKKAGIQPGDVLVEVEGEEITEVSDVWKALRNKEGDVRVELIRDKRRVNLTAKVEKPDRQVQIFRAPEEMRREMQELRDRIQSLEKRLEKLERR